MMVSAQGCRRGTWCGPSLHFTYIHHTFALHLFCSIHYYLGFLYHSLLGAGGQHFRWLHAFLPHARAASTSSPSTLHAPCTLPHAHAHTHTVWILRHSLGRLVNVVAGVCRREGHSAFCDPVTYSQHGWQGKFCTHICTCDGSGWI